MTDAWAIRVERTAVGGVDDSPKRILLGGRTVEIIEVIDRWLGADHAYYKVRGADGATYIVREDAAGHWQLIMIDRLPASV
jgi:hypothetical protein